MLFCYNLEAANVQYPNCRNKNFANFKGLKKSKADLAFLVKSVVIDHTFMTISLNFADFTDFFLLKTLISLPFPFHLLCWLKSLPLRLENYLEFSRFFPCGQWIQYEDTKLMLLFARLLNWIPPQSVSEGVLDLLILKDSVIANIHSRRNQPPLSLIMANIVYLIRETFAITLRNLLKQDLTHLLNTKYHSSIKDQFLQTFAAAKASLALMRVSMIPGIVVLFS